MVAIYNCKEETVTDICGSIGRCSPSLYGRYKLDLYEISGIISTSSESPKDLIILRSVE